MIENSAIYFRAWGIDNISYGPVELPTLVNWLRDGRVLADTWVFREDKAEWCRAADITELKPLFKSRTAGGAAGNSATTGITANALRRIKILADMEEKQLTSFLQYLEVLKLNANSVIFQKGDHADSMYFVLEGEARARVMVGGKETTLSTMGAGECFGELALLDHGPRSADVIANKESVVLKISAASLKRLFDEAPALAAPFLLALNRSITGRLRTLTKHYEDTVHFARTASSQ